MGKVVTIVQNLNTSADWVANVNNLPSAAKSVIVRSIVLSGDLSTADVNVYTVFCNFVENNILGSIAAYNTTAVSNPLTELKLLSPLTNQLQFKIYSNDTSTMVATVTNRRICITLEFVD